MNICYNRLDLPYPPRLAMLLAVEHSILGIPSGKCQRGEFFYLLWNVPIQIFAICYITLDIYNGFRCRKGWHSTLDKKLWYMLGFHFY